MVYFKNHCYSLGLSKNGRIIIYVKSDLGVFPKEFCRSLREDFSFHDNMIFELINNLEFIELEISHKINDPYEKLKDARVEYKIDDLVHKLKAFTDNSFGKYEIELKGDPKTSGNLDFLLRDKLNAVLFFSDLTKIMAKFIDIQTEIKEAIDFIKKMTHFLINDLLNKK